MATHTLSWNEEQVQILAGAMQPICKAIDEEVENLKKDIVAFEADDAFGQSKHMEGLKDALNELKTSIEGIPAALNTIQQRIQQVADTQKISLNMNFKNTEEAKNALAAAKRKVAN